MAAKPPLNRPAAVFLSAGVPEPDHAPFSAHANPDRIREAVVALVGQLKRHRLHLVFGGHPAISPLIHQAALKHDVIDQITIYQSEHFWEWLPSAAREFPRLRWTAAGTTRAESVARMREEMLAETEWSYRAAVFVGGMERILQEYRSFLEAQRGAACYPLASTGGAALQVFFQHAPVLHDPDLCERLEQDLDYRRLLDELLSGL